MASSEEPDTEIASPIEEKEFNSRWPIQNNDSHFQEDINLEGSLPDEVSVNENQSQSSEGQNISNKIMGHLPLPQGFEHLEAKNENPDDEKNDGNNFGQQEFDAAKYELDQQRINDFWLSKNDTGGSHFLLSQVNDCTICGKSFENQCNLKIHVTSIHQKVKDFKCDFCESTFSVKRSLTTHIQNVHVGLRKYKCDFCSKAFTSLYNLKSHVTSIHQKLKGHKCHLCDKSFSQKSNLQTHIKSVHESSKNFPCSLCDKSYKEKRNLHLHVKTVHEGIRDFHCYYCEKSFTQEVVLERHLLAIHNHITMKSLKGEVIDNSVEENMSNPNIDGNEMVIGEPLPLPLPKELEHLKARKHEDNSENFNTDVSTLQNETSAVEDDLDENNDSSEDVGIDSSLLVEISMDDSPSDTNERQSKTFEGLDNSLHEPQYNSSQKKPQLHINSFHGGMKPENLDFDPVQDNHIDLESSLPVEVSINDSQSEILSLGKNNFQCHLCEKSYSSKRNLQLHIKSIHEGVKSYKCSYCPKSFTQEHSRKRHLAAVHKVQQSQNISVKSEDGNLSIEKSQVENDQRMEIKVDGYKVWNTNPVNLKLENNSHSWDTTDNFPPNNTVDSINGLKQEWKNESGDSNSSKNPIKTENIDTEISGAAFANTYSHSVPSQEQDNLKFEIDPNATGTLNPDGISLQTPKPYKCGLCEKSFASLSNLKAHNKCVHQKIKMYQCQWENCDKSFSQKSNLLTHVKSVHKGVKQFQCPFCEKSYKDKRNLTLHVRVVHIGTKDYQCIHCEKGFTQEHALKRHVTSFHTGLKKYKCNVCYQEFETPNELKQHLQTDHIVANVVKCHLCEKTFAKNNNLKAHIERIHLKLKNHQCDFCEKSFSHKKQLDKHIIGVHPEMAQVSPNNSNHIIIEGGHDNLNPSSEVDILDENNDSNFQEDIDLDSSLPLEVSIDDSQNEFDETLEEIEEEEEHVDEDDNFDYANAAGAEIKIEIDELDD